MVKNESRREFIRNVSVLAGASVLSCAAGSAVTWWFTKGSTSEPTGDIPSVPTATQIPKVEATAEPLFLVSSEVPEYLAQSPVEALDDTYLLPDIKMADITPELLETLPRFNIQSTDGAMIATIWGFRPRFLTYGISPFENGASVYTDRGTDESDPKYKLQNVNPDNGFLCLIEGQNDGREFPSGEAYLAVEIYDPNKYEVGVLLDTQNTIQELRKKSPHFPEFLQEYVSMERTTNVINRAAEFDVNDEEHVVMDYWPLESNGMPIVAPALDEASGTSNYTLAIRHKSY